MISNVSFFWSDSDFTFSSRLILECSPPRKTCFLTMFSLYIFIFSIRVFFHRHWRFAGQQGKGGDHLLFHTTTFIRSRTVRHLFATSYVRLLSRIFKRNACVYQTATRWDLPPYRISIWLIDWDVMFVCLFAWWFNIYVFVTAIWHRKPADLNSHGRSPLYYKLTN